LEINHDYGSGFKSLHNPKLDKYDNGTLDGRKEIKNIHEIIPMGQDDVKIENHDEIDIKRGQKRYF
jgi:hypothetical protein